MLELFLDLAIQNSEKKKNMSQNVITMMKDDALRSKVISIRAEEEELEI
jgi:hypothetical protein